MNYVDVTPKPQALELVINPDSPVSLAIAYETRLCESAAAMLELLKRMTFNSECLAHLRGMEKELLPLTDEARRVIDVVEMG